MGPLARSGHGRCATAPAMVIGSAEESMLPALSIRRSHPAATPSSASGHARRRGRSMAIAAIAALLLSAVGPAMRPATVSADGVPLPDLTFYGRGYGHGVGMSQYGARGRAQAGQLAPEILAHYYAKTTLWTTN